MTFAPGTRSVIGTAPLRRRVRRGVVGAVRLDFGLKQVHRRRAHEIGDEQIGRPVIDFLWRPDLLQDAVLHHRDLGGQRHGLDLVMRDIDDGGAGAVVQTLDLGAHIDAKLGVEIGERLVEQEEARISHQRPAHRHALPLTARKLSRPALQEMLHLQHPRHRHHRHFAFGLRDAAHLQREADILGDRHVRIERVGLEHHGDVALRRVQVIDRSCRLCGCHQR